MRNQFLTLVSYSIFIVLGGLRRLLLAVLMRDAVVLSGTHGEVHFWVFSKFDRYGKKTRRAAVL